MKHRMRNFLPGDRLMVNFGVHIGDRDMSCVQCRVVSVVNEGSRDVGLYCVDSYNRTLLLGSEQVTFIKHEGVS